MNSAKFAIVFKSKTGEIILDSVARLHSPLFPVESRLERIGLECKNRGSVHFLMVG